jgi:hypothetical protein
MDLLIWWSTKHLQNDIKRVGDPQWNMLLCKQRMMS